MTLGGSFMDIRLLQPDDASAFVSLLKKVDETGFMLYEGGERETTETKQRESIERIVKDELSTAFVAEDNGELIGYIFGMGNQLKRKRHCAYIVIGVVDDHQGKKIGTKLFETIIHWAEAKDLKRLELTVMKHNERALRLYQNMGFEIEGEKVASLLINGEFVDEYCMYKLL